jgi:hypothetical protein
MTKSRWRRPRQCWMAASILESLSVSDFWKTARGLPVVALVAIEKQWIGSLQSSDESSIAAAAVCHDILFSQASVCLLCWYHCLHTIGISFPEVSMSVMLYLCIYYVYIKNNEAAAMNKEKGTGRLLRSTPEYFLMFQRQSSLMFHFFIFSIVCGRCAQNEWFSPVIPSVIIFLLLPSVKIKTKNSDFVSQFFTTGYFGENHGIR